MSQVRETIELMPDETIQETEGRAGRILVIDQLERAWRGTKKRTGWLDTELYRVGRQVQADIELVLSVGGGGGLARCGDFFVPVTGGSALSAPQENANEAATRLRLSSQQVGYKQAWAALALFLADTPLRAIERQLRLRNGEAKRGIIEALERIAAAKRPQYETRKWRTPTWAAKEEGIAA